MYASQTLTKYTVTGRIFQKKAQTEGKNAKKTCKKAGGVYRIVSYTFYKFYRIDSNRDSLLNFNS